MKKTNKKIILDILKNYKNNKWYISNENDKETFLKLLNELHNEIDNKEIIDDFINSEYFAIIFTGEQKLKTNDPGDNMNDKLIEYLQGMETRIYENVDNKLQSMESRINDKLTTMETRIYKNVDETIKSEIDNLSNKMIKEFEKVNSRLDILEREATKHGWDLSSS